MECGGGGSTDALYREREVKLTRSKNEKTNTASECGDTVHGRDAGELYS